MVCSVANSYSLLMVRGYCEWIIQPSMLMKIRFQFFQRETSAEWFRFQDSDCADVSAFLAKWHVVSPIRIPFWRFVDIVSELLSRVCLWRCNFNSFRVRQVMPFFAALKQPAADVVALRPESHGFSLHLVFSQNDLDVADFLSICIGSWRSYRHSYGDRWETSDSATDVATLDARLWPLVLRPYAT